MEILEKKDQFLDLSLDPKVAWAIRNIDRFPIEINRASYEDLLKIPGLGPTYAKRIISARKFSNLSYDDLTLLKISLKKAINFITVNGIYRGIKYNSKEQILNIMRNMEGKKAIQLSFFN